MYEENKSEKLNMNIQDLIIQNLDILIMKQSEKPEALTMQKAIEIGAYVAAGVLRSRHKATGEVLPEEIEGVYGIVGNFYNKSFDTFTQEHFDELKKSSLDMMQKSTFDQDLDAFIQSIMEANEG